MEKLFREVRRLVAAKKFEELHNLSIIKPGKFNWVKEIFENINVKDHPDKHALIWTNGRETKYFSFAEM